MSGPYPKLVFQSEDCRVVLTGASAEGLIVEQFQGLDAMGEKTWADNYERQPDLLEQHLKQALFSYLGIVE